MNVNLKGTRLIVVLLLMWIIPWLPALQVANLQPHPPHPRLDDHVYYYALPINGDDYGLMLMWVIIGIALVMLSIYILKTGDRVRFLLIGSALYLSIIACFVCTGTYWALVSEGAAFEHVQTVLFRNQTYHLSLMHFSSPGSNFSMYQVYHCEENDNSCTLVNEFMQQPTNNIKAVLTVDDIGNVLYIDREGELTPVSQ